MSLILGLIAITFSALALWSDGTLRTLFTAIIIAAYLAAFLLDIFKHRVAPTHSKEGQSSASGS